MPEDKNHRNGGEDRPDYQDLIFDWNQPAETPERYRRRNTPDGNGSRLTGSGVHAGEESGSPRNPQSNARVLTEEEVQKLLAGGKAPDGHRPDSGTSPSRDSRTTSENGDLLSLDDSGTGQPGKSGKAAGTGRSERPGKTDRKGLSERSGRAGRTRNTERAGKAGRTGPSERSGRAGRTRNTERAGKAERKRPKKTGKRTAGRKSRSRRIMFTTVIVLAAVLLVLFGYAWKHGLFQGGGSSGTGAVSYDELPSYVDEQYLTVNSWSRPGIRTENITGVVIHYTADPGKDAQEIHDYFEGLASSHEARASANFVVGLDGSVIACVPLGEVAYASNSRNLDTISVEYCYSEESGKPGDETYQRLLDLCEWLCGKYGLSGSDVIRHYDVNGTSCPQYFVDNPEAWTEFRAELADRLKQ